MKTGKTLVELAEEIERQKESKRDYIVPDKKLRFTTDKNLNVEFGENILDPTKHFHRQIGTKVKIPAKYYDRMRTEAPELLANNVNHWLSKSNDSRMIRTLDGNARAYLSDRYRALDNADLAEAVLPELYSFSDIEVVSTEITPTRMYIKAVNKRVEGEVEKGDVVQAGLVIRNSEVGHGALAIEPLVYRLVCLNRMISNDNTMKKYHVGRQGSSNVRDSWEVFSDKTKQLTDAAVWSQVKDLTREALSESLFRVQLDKIKEAAGQEIENNPAEVVEIVQKDFGLTEDEGGSVLRHLIEGGDLSRWGLTNAITRASQDVEDYERATEFERLGGQIIELSPKKWETIACN